MPIGEAVRRCPCAIFLDGDPPKYVYYSIRLFALLREFSPLVEPFSIDEAFVEVSGQAQNLAGARSISRSIQAAVAERLGLTASVGVGPNKLIAKMASGVAKPNGLTVLDRVEFQRHFWPLPAGDLWGVGEKTAAALRVLGIITVGDLAACPRAPLLRAFGVVGGILQEMARGNDDTPLIPYYEGLPVKSMGHEHTLARDEADPGRLDALLLRLAEQVARRLRSGGKQGRTVTVKLRFGDFRTITRQRTLGEPTDEERVIYPVARDLMDRNRGGAALRLAGLSVSGLVDRTPPAYLFAEDRRYRDILGAVDALRDRFGEEVLTRARILGFRTRRGPAPPHGRPQGATA
jgi:DNA polymerase-4